LPSMSFQREISTGKVSANSYIRHYKGEKWSFESKWTAFDGFGSWNMLQQAQANLKTVKLEEKKVRGDIIEETKRAYYNLDKAYKNLEMQLENRERVEQFYQITSKAYESELVPHVDYLNVKGLNLQTGFQYISAEEDVELAELVLFQALNLDPDDEISIEPVERPQELISVGLENCYRLALSNNPDYQTKINALQYYELERKIMRAKGYPKIDLHWSAGKMVEKFEPMFLPADYTSPDNAGSPARADRGFEPEWFFGVKSSLPLWGNTLEHNYVREQWAPTVSAFRGTQTATNYFTVNVLDDLAYFSNLQEARAGFERAKYEQQKARQDLIVQVKEIYFKYRKALLNIEVAEAKLDHQEKYVSVLAERHRFGEMNMPTLIEEYEKLIEFEFALLSAYTDYYISIVQLNAVTGISDHFKPSYEKKGYKEYMADRGVTPEDGPDMKETDPAKAAEYLEKARRFIRRGDLRTARDMATKAREYAPDSAGARAVVRKIDDALAGGRK
ncbi:MAG: hypothetical protein GF392_02785, partial [Candidatus Omnitrophica bacterium]|nr:hypothetical protein [Candidatus Omnitrophota bacterium]